MEAEHPQLDVAILGGGIAGLWTLDTLGRAGYRCCLFERDQLGRGQTIQSQGIIHGGGKYSLRAVGDIAAMRAIREMPERWRASLRGSAKPALSSDALLSSSCDLWLPRSGWRDRLLSWGLRPLLKQPGLLSARPVDLPREDWPEALKDARSVLRMPEPVLDTGRVLRDIADGWPGHVHTGVGEVSFRAAEQAVELRFEKRGNIRTRAVVLCAGAGNGELLREAGFDAAAMQIRPLRMFLLRGPLPPLYAHCVSGGRTRLTITSFPLADSTVWQVGGELAERFAEEADPPTLKRILRDELRACLPSLKLSTLRMSSYAARRAEAADPRGRRPSGVHLALPHPRVFVAWPTKLALAPVLADEIRARVGELLPEAEPGPGQECTHEDPVVASYPWEECEWEALG